MPAQGIIARILGARGLAAIIIVSLASSLLSGILGAGMLAVGGLVSAEPEPPTGYGLLTVYSGFSLHPATGLLARGHVEAARGVPGVVDAWGEIVVPVLSPDGLVIVRGVEHSPMAEKLVGAVIPGEGLQAVTGRQGEGWIRVRSLYTGDEIPLYITRTHLNPPYKGEIIVGIETAASLRGDESYTLVRVLYDPETTSPATILAAMGVQAAGLERLAERLIVLAGRGAVPPEEAARLVAARLGVPLEALLSATLLVAVILSLPAAAAAAGLVRSRRASLEQLAWHGYPEGSVRAWTALLAGFGGAVGAITGQALLALVPPVLVLGVFVDLQPQLEASAAYTLIVLLATVWGAWRSV